MRGIPGGALVESLPLDRRKQPFSAAGWPSAASPGAASGVFPPRSTDPAIRARLHLQQRAPANRRHHLQRSVARVAVLIAADLLSFALMRALVQAVRDHAVLGGAVAGGVASVLQPGILNGWQYVSALLVGLFVTGNYGRGDERRNPQRLFLGCALATALPLWMTIWTRGVQPVLLQYAVTTVLMWLGLLAERLTVNRAAAWVRPPERDRLGTLFVGPGAECASALQTPAFTTGVEYRPIGFVDSRLPLAPGAIGHIAEFSLLLAATGAQVVVLCGYLTAEQFREIVDTALMAGCKVLSVPRSVKIAGVHPTTVWRRGQPLVELTAPGLKGWQLALKRVVDVGGAGVGLIVLGPVFAVVAAIVKLESPGPVFFSQDRVGLGGRPFRIIKFRTMVDGADGTKAAVAHLNHSSDPRLFKIPNDPRATRMGRWFRRWSLDELPQLWNVLLGDMALVGPRPFFESDLPHYEAHHFSRLGAKPGITGLWQVSGRSEVLDFDEVVALDTRYIRDWSLLLDFKILLLTIPAVLRRRGAL